MVLYLDTSALVKRYFRKHFSDELLATWRSADQIVTSSVTYAEAMASIQRKEREAGLSDALLREIVDSYHRGWESFLRVEVNDELNGYIDQVVKDYSLRTCSKITWTKLPSDLGKIWL